MLPMEGWHNMWTEEMQMDCLSVVLHLAQICGHLLWMLELVSHTKFMSCHLSSYTR